jgi:hypothetical protein
LRLPSFLNGSSAASCPHGSQRLTASKPDHAPQQIRTLMTAPGHFRWTRSGPGAGLCPQYLRSPRVPARWSFLLFWLGMPGARWRYNSQSFLKS